MTPREALKEAKRQYGGETYMPLILRLLVSNLESRRFPYFPIPANVLLRVCKKHKVPDEIITFGFVLWRLKLHTCTRSDVAFNTLYQQFAAKL